MGERLCDHCGNFDLTAHCESPCCPWLRCSRASCGAFGRPGSMYLPALPAWSPDRDELARQKAAVDDDIVNPPKEST